MQEQQSSKNQQGSYTENRHARRPKLAAVKQEPDGSSQPAIAATCTCGGRGTRCSAPGCHQLYCQPCDNSLKATDPAKGFKTRSFYCCVPRTGFTKAQFCATHCGLFFKCVVCQETFCKRPCCSQCKMAVCGHCIDDHEETNKNRTEALTVLYTGERRVLNASSSCVFEMLTVCL